MFSRSEVIVLSDKQTKTFCRKYPPRSFGRYSLRYATPVIRTNPTNERRPSLIKYGIGNIAIWFLKRSRLFSCVKNDADMAAATATYGGMWNQR